MIETSTPNTQVILLLTAPLLLGHRNSTLGLLSLSEYNRLARVLRENQKQPADLIGPDHEDVLTLCTRAFDRPRLEALLGRGFLLSQALDRWNTHNIWVISRADDSYPKRIKMRLKGDAPPVLYGSGEKGLLQAGGLAVVGSRHTDEELIYYTERVGKLTAEAGQTVVSGGAKGVDQASMQGAVRAGGTAVGVMADSLERAALKRENREGLMERRLALISPYDPAAGFNVGHAMQRNKIVYALADAALVVTSDFERGGTWAGAVEQLERFRFVPVYVRNGAGIGKGNMALLQHGARPWPNPSTPAELEEVLRADSTATAAEPEQKMMTLVVDRLEDQQSTVQSVATIALTEDSPSGISSADELFRVVRSVLIRELVTGRNEADVAELLSITKQQARIWLARLVNERVLKKIGKPVRYCISERLDQCG